MKLLYLFCRWFYLRYNRAVSLKIIPQGSNMTQSVQQGVAGSFKVVGVNKFGSDVAAPTPVSVDPVEGATVVVTGDTFTFETDGLVSLTAVVKAADLSVSEVFTVTPDVTATSIKVVPVVSA